MIIRVIFFYVAAITIIADAAKRRAADELTIPGQTLSRRAANQRKAIERRQERLKKKKEEERLEALKGEEQRLENVKHHLQSLKEKYQRQQLIKAHRLRTNPKESVENSLRKKETQAELKQVKVLATLEKERNDKAREKRMRNDKKFAKALAEQEHGGTLPDDFSLGPLHGKSAVLRERREKANAKKQKRKKRDRGQQEAWKEDAVRRWQDTLHSGAAGAGANSSLAASHLSNAQVKWERRQMKWIYCREGGVPEGLEGTPTALMLHRTNCSALLGGQHPRHPHSHIKAESSGTLNGGDKGAGQIFGTLPLRDGEHGDLSSWLDGV